jgi:hypothetical protein
MRMNLSSTDARTDTERIIPLRSASHVPFGTLPGLLVSRQKQCAREILQTGIFTVSTLFIEDNIL